MSSYRADIEIGVRGARSLEQLRSSINQTARAVDSLNDVVSARGSLVQNIQNYTNNLNRAAQSLRMVGAGTQAETKAIREYVRALGEANTARARQNSLVAQEVANQRRVSAGTAPYGQQGPALPPAIIKGRQIQQNWNRFFQEAAQVGQELQTTAAAKTVNIKNSWNRFFQEAAQVAVELTVQAQRTSAAIRSKEGAASVVARQRLADAAAQRQRITNAGFGVQGPALPPTASGTAGRGQGIRGRLGGAISGSIIGGSFPFLFGQGGGAATGGVIGGLVGGLAGPGGSFAGSLLGTLLGDIASRGQAVKQLGTDLGFSAQQTKQLSDAFKVANTDVEKFTAVIQNIRGVGLEVADQAKAIQLVTRLTELYGGSFEKTGNAITSALESGKVSQATLNQLTSQGVNIQQALADKYGVSRSAILEMAKDGDISVQTLIDTLVTLGNDSEKVAVQQQNVFQSAYDQIVQAAVQAAQTASGSFASTGNELQETARRIQAAFTSMFNELVRGTTEFILGLGEIARIAGTALDSVLSKFVGIQYGIIEAAQSLPVLDSGIVEFAKNALAVLNPVGALIDKIRGAGRNRPEQFGPPVPERLKRAPLTGFAVPSQLAGGGAGGAKGPKPPENRTAQLQEDLQAMQLMSVTQDGIRDALYEGDRALAIRLEYDQKVYDINRDTAKAIMNANYETEKAVIRAQEIVRLKDAELEKLDKERELRREIEDVYKETFRSLQEGIDWEKGFLKSDEIGEFIKNAVQELRNLQLAAISVSQGIGDAIGSALTNGIVDLVSGASTVKQVFADLMQSVGQVLANEGAKMIATYIAIGIAKLFAGLGGGSIFGGKMGVDTFGTISTPGLEGAGALGNGLGLGGGIGLPMPGGIPGYAEGGHAIANRPYVVGEKGPELFVPGATGSVVPAKDIRQAMGVGSNAAGAPVLNMSFQTTNIGGVEYVSRDQLEQAMAATRRQAVSDGAKRGMSMTLDKLQQSPGTRSRVGLR